MTVKNGLRVYGFIGAMVKGNSFNSNLWNTNICNGEILASYQSHNKLIRRYFIENLDLTRTRFSDGQVRNW